MSLRPREAPKSHAVQTRHALHLGDRSDRRPVLIASLLTLGLDYLLMALAPNLMWLFIGRAVAGVAGATFATANAYIADVSDPDMRA